GSSHSPDEFTLLGGTTGTLVTAAGTEWMGDSWAAVSGPGATPSSSASMIGTATSPAGVTPATGTSDTSTGTAPSGLSDTASASTLAVGGNGTATLTGDIGSVDLMFGGMGPTTFKSLPGNDSLCADHHVTQPQLSI